MSAPLEERDKSAVEGGLAMGSSEALFVNPNFQRSLTPVLVSMIHPELFWTIFPKNF